MAAVCHGAPLRDWSLPGPFLVTVTNETWTDASRSREVPVRIYSPVGESGPRAVIVFSHGLGGNIAAGEDWGRQWASWGIVSVHIQHHGTDTDAIRDGSGSITERLKSAMTPQELPARARDASFAATEIARRTAAGDAPFAGVVPTEMGLSGHSFGAQTTLAVAGEWFPGALSNMADPRFKAFVAFSPSSRSFGSLDRTFRSIAAPFLSLTGSQDQISLTPKITPANRILPFEHMPPGDKYLCWLDTATHMSFGGQATSARAQSALAPALGAGQAKPDQPHIDRVVKAVTTAFWFAYLTPDTATGREAKAWLTSGGPKPMLAPADRWETK